MQRRAQVQAAARLVLGQRPRRAEAVFFGNQRLGREQAAQLRHRERVERDPRRVRLPMPREIRGRAQMPARRAGRVKDLVAVGKGARRQREILARIVERRIVRHARHEIAPREQEMRREENARRRRGLLRRLEDRRFHGKDAIGIEMGELQPRPGERAKSLAPIRLAEEPRQIRREDRIARRAARQLRAQEIIPAGDEAMVRIELQIKLLALVALLDARPRPARPLAFPRRDVLVPHAHPPRPRLRRHRHIRLLEDRKGERARLRRFRHHVVHGAREVRVAIGGEGDENTHGSMKTERPVNGNRWIAKKPRR